MTDALLLGLDHALFALAYVAGAGLPAAAVAASARLCGLPLYRVARRRVVSRRLHAHARRSGRTVDPDAWARRERARKLEQQRVRDLIAHTPYAQQPEEGHAVRDGSESITTGR